MSKQMKQVVEFNHDILGITPRDLGVQSKNEFDLSVKQLREEIDELEEAYEKGDFIQILDAIHDLQYFSYGVLYKCGVTPEIHEQIFSAIHNCNMAKVKGVKEGREGHGNAADAVKPESWTAPETHIQHILESHKCR